MKFRKNLLELKLKFDEFKRQVNLKVFLLIVLFTCASWLDLTAVWCELPIIVHELVEGWRTPSVLSIVIQIAQIGSLVYLLLKLVLPRIFTYRHCIYFILLIGEVSCILIAIFWNRKVLVFGRSMSLPLFILNFSFALLDGTSTVTFLPYISERFGKEYIIANYIGESFSALIPSIIALIQGIGNEMGCVNETLSLNLTGNYSNSFETFGLKPVPLRPRFSVSVYFMIVSIILFASCLSFVFIDCSKYVRKYYKAQSPIRSSQVAQQENEKRQLESSLDIPQVPNVYEKPILFSIITCITFFFYGFLPSIQSYSALPYGNTAFYLAINLSNFSLPIAIFLSIWSFNVSLKRILIEFSVALAFTIYVIVLSAQSPCPFLVQSPFGAFLVIVSWVTLSFLYIRLRCLIATRLEKYGSNSLFILGIFSLLGQVLGGIVGYLSVDVFGQFEEKPACVNDFSYCSQKS